MGVSSRDYVAEIGMVEDLRLRQILLRLNDSIETLKETMTALTTAGSANASSITGLDSRLTIAEATIKQILYSGYQDFPEIADPNAPVRDNARIYARDNGAGKTQMVARFPTGAIQTIVTEP